VCFLLTLEFLFCVPLLLSLFSLLSFFLYYKENFVQSRVSSTEETPATVGELLEFKTTLQNSKPDIAAAKTLLALGNVVAQAVGVCPGGCTDEVHRMRLSSACVFFSSFVLASRVPHPLL
jgi:hypothetical protein